jgi:hypothetical protein
MAKNRGGKKKDIPVLVAKDLCISNWTQSINAEPTEIFGIPGPREWLPRMSEPVRIQISGIINGVNVELSMDGGIIAGDLREILGNPQGANSSPLKLTISKER